ncbi:hypothetical protein pb186bvf_003707 [Paramecium bursaria]
MFKKSAIQFVKLEDQKQQEHLDTKLQIYIEVWNWFGFLYHKQIAFIDDNIQLLISFHNQADRFICEFTPRVYYQDYQHQRRQISQKLKAHVIIKMVHLLGIKAYDLIWNNCFKSLDDLLILIQQYDQYKEFWDSCIIPQFSTNIHAQELNVNEDDISQMPFRYCVVINQYTFIFCNQEMMMQVSFSQNGFGVKFFKSYYTKNVDFCIYKIANPIQVSKIKDISEILCKSNKNKSDRVVRQFIEQFK